MCQGLNVAAYISTGMPAFARMVTRATILGTLCRSMIPKVSSADHWWSVKRAQVVIS